jgi:hypothetical protein
MSGQLILTVFNGWYSVAEISQLAGSGHIVGAIMAGPAPNNSVVRHNATRIRKDFFTRDGLSG